MRLLVDDHQIEWEQAWHVTQSTFSYTNHTLLPEALEKWPLPLFGSLLPRHLEIIFEINRQFLDELRMRYPGDDQRLSRMSLIDETGERYVRMAHLASVGSHAINGVGEVINTDPDVAGRLKVVFFPDYKVKNAKFIYPAADLSELISTAGKAASGTGNMKFALNGTLTIGTLDGANIEIREEVGANNFFLFGLTAERSMN